MAQTLCLERELAFELSFHARIEQTGIYLKEPDGSREFLTLYCWGPGFKLNLGSGFRLSCWPWIENSLLLTIHLVPKCLLLSDVSNYLPTERMESQTKSIG